MPTPTPPQAAEIEHFEVVIVGAGLSGIGAAAHLQMHCPDKRYLVLEARDAIGGTWDLFRYPGIRSDSDMQTLGYAFKPWGNRKAIADGASIRHYIAETAHEHGITPHIRFGHRLLRASWSSADARWLLEVEHGPQRERRLLSCGVMDVCSGFFRYEEGHRPPFPGEDRFQGTWVHPQFWPEGLDCTGRRVVVIGSGATAMTVVPALAQTASHVTLLQRSPTYVVSFPASDPIANVLNRWLPAMLAHRLVRAKNVGLTLLFFKVSRLWPAWVRKLLIERVGKQLPAGCDAQQHFAPRYQPWDQRICLVPDGDLFKAMRDGRASVVTDTINTFTERGLRLHSGQELEADIVVTATGLNLNLLGDVVYEVDGERIDFARRFAYKAMMFNGVPNLIYTYGYTNASWTLKADLTARYLCRLLKHMDRHGQQAATPRFDPTVQARPFFSLSSGYVQRASHTLPQQGDKSPWKLYQNYLLDLLMLRFARLDDGTLVFSSTRKA